MAHALARHGSSWGLQSFAPNGRWDTYTGAIHSLGATADPWTHITGNCWRSRKQMVGALHASAADQRVMTRVVQSAAAAAAPGGSAARRISPAELPCALYSCRTTSIDVLSRQGASEGGAALGAAATPASHLLNGPAASLQQAMIPGAQERRWQAYRAGALPQAGTRQSGAK